MCGECKPEVREPGKYEWVFNVIVNLFALWVICWIGYHAIVD